MCARMRLNLASTRNFIKSSTSTSTCRRALCPRTAERGRDDDHGAGLRADGHRGQAECRDDGEITLRGRVLPIGGLKEKLLAAHRAGIDTVLIPKENLKDLEEVPANVREALTIIPAEDVHTVLETALCEKPTPKQQA